MQTNPAVEQSKNH